MILYKLYYQWQGIEGQIDLEAEGIFYLDLADTRILLFNNPPEGDQALVLVTHRKVYVVRNGKGYELGQNPQSIDDLTLSVSATEDLLNIDYKKILDRGKGLFQRFRKSRYWRWETTLLILPILVLPFLMRDKKPRTESFESEISENTRNLSGKALTDKYLVLAGHYFDAGNDTIALELTQKVLKALPGNEKALKLQQAVLKRQDETKLAAQKNLQRDIHFKELLNQASAFMAQNDLQSAMMNVEQILQDDPQNAEALQTKAALNRELEKVNEKKMQMEIADQDKIHEAEGLWKEGQSAAGQKDFVHAFKSLTKANELLQESHASPPFRPELTELLDKTKNELFAVIKPLIDKARLLRKQSENELELARIESLKNALAQYFEAQKLNPHHPRLTEEIDSTLRRLDTALNTYVTEARTIRDLEGCCAAEPKYKKIMTLAKYEEVPAYKKAHEALEQCPCQ